MRFRLRFCPSYPVDVVLEVGCEQVEGRAGDSQFLKGGKKDLMDADERSSRMWTEDREAALAVWSSSVIQI